MHYFVSIKHIVLYSSSRGRERWLLCYYCICTGHDDKIFTYLITYLLSYRCIVTINSQWLFLTVPWVGLQYVIVLFSDHTHILFGNFLQNDV